MYDSLFFTWCRLLLNNGKKQSFTSKQIHTKEQQSLVHTFTDVVKHLILVKNYSVNLNASNYKQEDSGKQPQYRIYFSPLLEKRRQGRSKQSESKRVVPNMKGKGVYQRNFKKWHRPGFFDESLRKYHGWFQEKSS